MINRRTMMVGGVAAAIAAWQLWRQPGGATAGQGKAFEIVKSEDEWRKVLTKEQFYVLRKHGTERAFTSPLNDNKAVGTYHCAGCALPLYSSQTKFDSGTGWPSFWAPIENAVGTSTDYIIGYPRTEVHCARCGGHQGHVFDDGPQPTGKRHCINGVALTFVPANA